MTEVSLFQNTLDAMQTGDGAAIYNAGTTAISRSSFVGNSAPGSAQIYNTGILSITNSTLSGLNGASAIGITSTLGSALFVGGVTIAHHTFRGISYLGDADPFFLFRTAFNDNAQDCHAFAVHETNSAFNVFEDMVGNCGQSFAGTTNVVAGLDDADLSPLLTTRLNLVTHYYDIPGLGSLLVDQGGTLEQGCALTTDQRGEPRPLDGNANGTVVCDAGAVEFNTRLFTDGFEDF